MAVADIAQVAADLLADASWTGQDTVPVFGPDHLTPQQMCETMGEELGTPVEYR